MLMSSKDTIMSYRVIYIYVYCVSLSCLLNIGIQYIFDIADLTSLIFVYSD